MYQQIIVVGYLGRDPEMRFTPNGKAVTSFSVATSRSYTNTAGAKVDETTWFRVSVWGGQAEPCATYLKKGSPVLVVGRLKPDKNTGGPTVYTKNDGTPGASFEINAQNVKFLPSGKGNGSGAPLDDYEDVPNNEENEKEIPF
jgi:single-strand DNA-binding protein